MISSAILSLSKTSFIVSRNIRIYKPKCNLIRQPILQKNFYSNQNTHDESINNEGRKNIEQHQPLFLTNSLKKILLKNKVKEKDKQKNNRIDNNNDMQHLTPESIQESVERGSKLLESLQINANSYSKAIKMFNGTIEFLDTHTIDDLDYFLDEREKIKRVFEPYLHVPQVCFVGRSNVGKSSLINALIPSSKKLLRVSQTPGSTQSLQMVFVDKKLIIVDMPGYGYSSLPKLKKRSISSLMEYYFENKFPSHVFILVDSRRGLVKADRDLMEFLSKVRISHKIVLTKVDKISKDELDSLLEKIDKDIVKHQFTSPDILATSSKEKFGINELKQNIYESSSIEERKLLFKR